MLVTLSIVGLVAVVGLEWWRRAVAKRTPRWISHAVVTSYFALAGGIALTWWGVIHAFAAVPSDSAGGKASLLATGIAHALDAAAVGLACALGAAVLLAIVTLRR